MFLETWYASYKFRMRSSPGFLRGSGSPFSPGNFRNAGRSIPGVSQLGSDFGNRNLHLEPSGGLGFRSCPPGWGISAEKARERLPPRFALLARQGDNWQVRRYRTLETTQEKTLWKTLLQKNLHVSKRPKTLDSCFIPIGSCNDHPNKKHGCMMYPHTTQRTFLSLAWNRQPGTSLQLGNRLRRMLRLVWHTRPKVFFSVSYLRVLKKILPRAQKMRPK